MILSNVWKFYRNLVGGQKKQILNIDQIYIIEITRR